MNPVDHIFILALFLALPLYGLFETRGYEARARAGEPFDRIRFYRHTAIMEWAILAAVTAAWFFFGRPFGDLGLTKPAGVGFHAGAAVLLLVIGQLLYSWRCAKRASAPEKAKQLESIGEIVQFVPHTRCEFRSFVYVSITAGIVEEIVYRGFVLWYLSLFMPVWLALAVSSIGFGLAHSYQGVKGAVRCGLVGLAFGILYVVTGSIWLPIIGHALLDVLQGAAIREFLRKDGEALEPQPA